MADLPVLSGRILVFSDFNCPYCFTLAEWINGANAAGAVRWIGIEHRPDLPNSGVNAPDDAALLDREVEDIHRRAPEVGVQRPPAWWNSRHALLLQNCVEVDFPE